MSITFKHIKSTEDYCLDELCNGDDYIVIEYVALNEIGLYPPIHSTAEQRIEAMSILTRDGYVLMDIGYLAGYVYLRKIGR